MDITSKQFGLAVLYGLATILIFATVCSLISAFILKFSSVQESSLQVVITAVSFISLFIGGFISGGKGKEKGWMLGGATGLLNSIILFLFQYLGLNSLFNKEQLIYHTCFILIAMMGGILGVNLTTSKTRTV